MREKTANDGFVKGRYAVMACIAAAGVSFAAQATDMEHKAKTVLTCPTTKAGVAEITCDNPGGWKVTSKINGKSIYIPASGQRTNMNLDKDKGLQAYYWTSQRDEDGDNFAISLGRFKNVATWNTQYVCMGSTVRPVCP